MIAMLLVLTITGPVDYSPGVVLYYPGRPDVVAAPVEPPICTGPNCPVPTQAQPRSRVRLFPRLFGGR